MAVAGLAMVRPKSSGVMYTRDLSDPEADRLEVSAVWGLGEELVSGQTVPDSFGVDRQRRTVVSRTISRKRRRLVGLPEGGTGIEEVPETEWEQPALTDETVLRLADYGLRLETFFGRPQDVEWAQDLEGKLFLLQSRPLHFLEPGGKPLLFEAAPGLPVIFSGGQTASPGRATGPAWVLRGEEALASIPEGVILVAPTASPKYARLAGRVTGLVTEMGSVTSHLASGGPGIRDTLCRGGPRGLGNHPPRCSGYPGCRLGDRPPGGQMRPGRLPGLWPASLFWTARSAEGCGTSWILSHPSH